MAVGMLVGVNAPSAAAALPAGPASFANDANLICAAASRAAHAVGTPANASQAAADALKALANVTNLARDLRGLHAPGKETATFAVAIADLGREDAPYRQAHNDAASPPRYNADIRRADAVDVTARAQFHKLGLVACALWDD